MSIGWEQGGVGREGGQGSGILQMFQRSREGWVAVFWETQGAEGCNVGKCDAGHGWQMSPCKVLLDMLRILSFKQSEQALMGSKLGNMEVEWGESQEKKCVSVQCGL